MFVPLPDKVPVEPIPPTSFWTEMDFDDEFNKEIANATRIAFESYFYNCRDSDEINALTGKCLQTYGFQSTLLESIETLKMLELDDLFNKSIRLVKSSFRCKNLGWVNRHELWSRVIGSLIGIYLMTGDFFFIDQAEECASLSLACEGINRLPSGFVNLKNQTRRAIIWNNGTSLNDAGGGLPELLALYQLTGNKTYYRLYDRTAQHLSKMSGNLWSFLTNRRGHRASDIVDLDAMTIGFYHNIALSNSVMRTSYSTRIMDASSVTRQRIFGNVSQYFNLIDADGFTGLDLKEDVINHYSEHGDLLRPGDNFHNGGLKYSGAPLRGLVKRYWKLGDYRAKTAVVSAIRSAIDTCHLEFGFSGIKHSNVNQFKFDGIQHTAFIAEWMKAGALLDPAFENLVKSGVFNERGHLLNYKLLHDNQPFV